MNKMAMHFGAGAIGRGFIGKLIADAGWDLVFVDVNEPLINYLKKHPTYTVHIATENKRSENVTIKDAILLSDMPSVLKKGRAASLLTCAVGPTILPVLAKTIAAIIKERKDQNILDMLHIIACENMIRASTALKKYVLENIHPSYHEYLEEHVAFVDSAVDRIVPPQENKELSADVLVEEFYEWIIDNTQTKNGFSIKGAQPVDNLLAYIERKLFIVNGGHATCAYFGYLYGYATIKDSMEDKNIYQLVQHVMKESAATLMAHYKMDQQSLYAYIEKILQRFVNPYLKDEVTRVGRQPLRKLAANERFILPLRRTQEYNLPHEHLTKAIAAALLFDYSQDSEANSLQEQIKTKNLTDVINNITENTLPITTVALICEQYDALKTIKKSL